MTVNTMRILMIVEKAGPYQVVSRVSWSVKRLAPSLDVFLRVGVHRILKAVRCIAR